MMLYLHEGKNYEIEVVSDQIKRINSGLITFSKVNHI
jgi:hypothetical protein